MRMRDDPRTVPLILLWLFPLLYIAFDAVSEWLK